MRERITSLRGAKATKQSRRTILGGVTGFVLLVVLLAGCAGKKIENPKLLPIALPAEKQLDPRLPWAGQNRERINQFLAAGPKGVAAFDWDNTTVKNDVSDALTNYFLKNDKIKRPHSWASMSKHLSQAALLSLNTHCSLKRKSAYLKTRDDKACSTALLCITRYDRLWDGVAEPGPTEKRCSGAEAYKLTGKATPETFQPGYAMSIALEAGYRPAEIQAIVKQVWQKQVANAVGTKTSVGYITGLEDSLRAYPQMKDLMAKLKANGFDVWILTASNRYVIQALAPEEAGVPADHVIGLTPTLDASHRMTTKLEGCGTIPDGAQDVLPYRQGKRCFLNKHVFHVTPAEQLTTPSQPVLAAGDSDSDVVFVSDATQLHLAIDRHKQELMCAATKNADGKWLAQPMFIEPLASAGSYSCK